MAGRSSGKREEPSPSPACSPCCQAGRGHGAVPAARGSCRALSSLVVPRGVCDTRAEHPARAEAAQHPWAPVLHRGGSAGQCWAGLGGLECSWHPGPCWGDSMGRHRFLELLPVNGSAATAEMHPLQGQPGAQCHGGSCRSRLCRCAVKNPSAWVSLPPQPAGNTFRRKFTFSRREFLFKKERMAGKLGLALRLLPGAASAFVRGDSFRGRNLRFGKARKVARLLCCAHWKIHLLKVRKKVTS